MSEQITILREDGAAWDARLARAYAEGLFDDLPFTQRAAWSESKRFTGWGSVRLVATLPSGAWAGAQFLLRSLPGPLGRLAYAPRGPIVSAVDPGEAAELRAALLGALRTMRADGVSAVRIELGTSVVIDAEGDVVHPPLALTGGLRDVWHTAARAAGVRLHAALPIQPSSSRRIDLRGGVEMVRAAWRSKWRQYARQAATDGVSVRVGGAADVHALTSVLEAIGVRTGIQIRSGDALATMMEAFGDRAELAIAEGAASASDTASVVLGALLVLRTESGSTELFGGATDRGNELRAPYALKAHAIERAAAQGGSWYDMWGLATPGIAHFKAGWGGEVHAYPGALDLDVNPLRGPLVRLALKARRISA
jgi:hypothetical protein